MEPFALCKSFTKRNRNSRDLDSSANKLLFKSLIKNRRKYDCISSMVEFKPVLGYIGSRIDDVAKMNKN